jgi:hypothetical protein
VPARPLNVTLAALLALLVLVPAVPARADPTDTNWTEGITDLFGEKPYASAHANTDPTLVYSDGDEGSGHLLQIPRKLGPISGSSEAPDATPGKCWWLARKPHNSTHDEGKIAASTFTLCEEAEPFMKVYAELWNYSPYYGPIRLKKGKSTDIFGPVYVKELQNQGENPYVYAVNIRLLTPCTNEASDYVTESHHRVRWSDGVTGSAHGFAKSRMKLKC